MELSRRQAIPLVLWPVWARADGISLPAKGSSVTPTAWNPADLTTITLSNTNHTATQTATFSGVRAVAGKSSGKYYFEVTCTSTSGCYIGLNKSTIPTNQGDSTGGVAVNAGGAMWVNNAMAGITLAGLSGSVLCIAVDLTANQFWARVGAAGNWNANAGNNPATGVGGVSFSGIAGSSLYPVFLTAGGSAQAVTANFGASAFSGAVPSGFSAGFG